MKKLLIIILCVLPFLSLGQSWVLRENVLKFPVGFEAWIKKHNGGVDIKDKKLETNQGVEIVDFNKDGKNDLIMQIKPSNEVTREYIRGIFIRDAYGNFNLDTNYVIKGKGDIWYGGAGDFNGDGLTDYHYLTQNYHGQDSLRKYSPEMVRDDWPDRVFINNGSKFDTLSLDKDSYTIKSSFVADLNNDGRDEIITTSKDIPTSVVVYSFNSTLKKFERIYDSITQFWKNKLTGNPGPEPVFNIGNYNTANKWALTFRDSPVSQNNGSSYGFQKFNFSQFDPKSLVNKEVLWERNERLISKSISLSDKDDYFKFNLSHVPSAYELDLNFDGISEYVTSGFYSTNTELGPSKFAYGFQVFDSQGKEVTDTYMSSGGYDDNVDLYLSSLDIDANFSGNEIIPCAWGVRLGDISYYYVRKENKLQKQFINVVSPSGGAIPSKTLTAKALIAFPNPKGINGLLLYDFQDLKSTSVISFEDCITTIPKITITGNSTFCNGDKVTLTSTESGSYLWSNGSTTQSIQVSKAGTYSVSVTNQKCTTSLNSSTISVVVNPIPAIPTITMEANGGLTSSASEGNQWYFDGVKIDNATQKTINPTKSGNYTVKVVTPCASEISKPYNLVVTSTEETILGQVSVSPNPVAGEFKVSFPVEFGKTAMVKIVDMSGNVQFKKASVNDGERIEVRNLNGGNYILHLQSNDNANVKAIKISKIQ
ncbi:T9SS type A sorting domain-containing protein [Aquirufa antheringensis]